MAAAAVDITDDFECPNFLVAVREIIGIPTGPICSTDVEGVTVLQIGRRNIMSLAGIEHFTRLSSLSADNNHLTELDVSSNTALQWLQIINNQLTELDVSNNVALERLIVSNNRLTELDVSNNTALELLFAYNNELTELYVTNNPVLRVLHVTQNIMTDPDDVTGWQDIPLDLLPEGVNRMMPGFHFLPQRDAIVVPPADITDDFTCPNFLAAVREVIGRPTGSIFSTYVAAITELRIYQETLQALRAFNILLR